MKIETLRTGIVESYRITFYKNTKNRLSQNSTGTYNKKNKGKKLPVLYFVNFKSILS